MGSRWKKSTVARALVERQQSKIDWPEVIGAIIAILLIIIVGLFSYNLVKFLFFQNII